MRRTERKALVTTIVDVQTIETPAIENIETPEPVPIETRTPGDPIVAIVRPRLIERWVHCVNPACPNKRNWKVILAENINFGLPSNKPACEICHEKMIRVRNMRIID